MSLSSAVNCTGDSPNSQTVMRLNEVIYVRFLSQVKAHGESSTNVSSWGCLLTAKIIRQSVGKPLPRAGCMAGTVHREGDWEWPRFSGT